MTTYWPLDADHRSLPNPERPDWHQQANCRGLDPALFFPDHGEHGGPAKAVCAGCTVRSECLDEAITLGERHGIRGGLTAYERRRLHLHHRKAAPE